MRARMRSMLILVVSGETKPKDPGVLVLGPGTCVTLTKSTEELWERRSQRRVVTGPVVF